MKKQDLKEKDECTLRDGSIYKKTKCNTIETKQRGYDLDYFNDDLTHIVNNSLDIVKVERYETIWEREEVPEYVKGKLTKRFAKVVKWANGESCILEVSGERKVWAKVDCIPITKEEYEAQQREQMFKGLERGKVYLVEIVLEGGRPKKWLTRYECINKKDWIDISCLCLYSVDFYEGDILCELSEIKSIKPTTTKQTAKLVKHEIKNGWFWDGQELVKIK